MPRKPWRHDSRRARRRWKRPRRLPPSCRQGRQHHSQAPLPQESLPRDATAPTGMQATLPAPEPSSMPPTLADQHPPSAEIAALVSRGDGFLRAGDITSARLFYERAADAGNASAALRLGATFDPGFLSRAGIRGIPGDTTQAASWYRRARSGGSRRRGAAGESRPAARWRTKIFDPLNSIRGILLEAQAHRSAYLRIRAS